VLLRSERILKKCFVALSESRTSSVLVCTYCVEPVVLRVSLGHQSLLRSKKCFLLQYPDLKGRSSVKGICTRVYSLRKELAKMSSFPITLCKSVQKDRGIRPVPRCQPCLFVVVDWRQSLPHVFELFWLNLTDTSFGFFRVRKETIIGRICVSDSRHWRDYCSFHRQTYAIRIFSEHQRTAGRIARLAVHCSGWVDTTARKASL